MYIEEFLFRFAILYVVDQEAFDKFIKDYKQNVSMGATLTQTFEGDAI